VEIEPPDEFELGMRAGIGGRSAVVAGLFGMVTLFDGDD